MKQAESASDRTLPARFRIDDLVVDLGQASVSRGGVRLSLPGLSFDLLVVLAKAAPDLVTHDDLMRRVWQGVIVSPETVAQRVKLLRDALGDDPREPRYVAGVRGRGYRLMHSIVPALEVHSAPEGASPSPATTRTDDAPTPIARAPADAAADDTANAGVAAPAVSSAPTSLAVPRAVSATASVPKLVAPTARRHTRIYLAAAAVALATGALLAVRPAWLFPAPPPGPSAQESVDVVGEQARTVAVLPFENLSPDPANEFIGLGVAEMVLNRLAGSPTLFVVARSSSFAFQKKNVDARRIGRDLGARYLVQGGVQRTGEQLRVTAQLVDAQSGRQMKVLRFDRSMGDLFALQDEIAAEVARALDVEVTPPPPGTRNPTAYLEYLQGLAALGKWDAVQAEKAIRHFARAQQLDPDFAPAYVGEAEARRQTAVLAEDDIERVRPELAKLTERALQLDPNLGSAYVLRAVLQKDPAAVEADLRRGIALAPNYGEGYYRLATRLLATRRTEAIELLDRAIAVDPMRVRYRYIRAIEGYEADGDGAAMEARLLEIMRIDPDSTIALEQLARAVSAYQGRFADGIRYAERALALNPQSRTARVYAAELYFAVGDFDAGRDAAQDPREISPVAIASAVARGDMRAAGRMALTPVPQPGGGPPAPVNAFGSVLSLAIVAAVLDESLHTKDYERGLRVLRERHCFPRDKERRCLELSTVMAAISIGQLLLASGRREEGEEQLAKVLELLAPMKDTFGLPPAARARAYAALGRDEDALRVLTTTPAKFAMAWWVTLERDPTYDSLRADPRFQSVLIEVRRHAAEQKARLDAMRRSGEVPMRPAASSPPRGASG